MTLTESDFQWLQLFHPKMRCNSECIEGTVTFRAAYNKDLDRFLILERDGFNAIGGLELSGEFDLRIVERSTKILTALPAVYLDGVEPIADRHFRLDKSACLCSPFEEQPFLEPQFRFKEFFEELVVPFLYGQVFFSQRNRWPWDEYAHGVAGLLEAYASASDHAFAQECLDKLSCFRPEWPAIRRALLQHPYAKWHGRNCICSKTRPTARCHPRAFQGLLRLQRHIRELSLEMPGTPSIEFSDNLHAESANTESTVS